MQQQTKQSYEFGPFRLDPVKRVLLKDSKEVSTFAPNIKDYKGTWSDPAADGEQHYYYIRVLQTDGEIAWASPLWITKK